MKSTSVLLLSVQIVPDALPHLYVMVCVNAVAFFVTVSVCFVPRVPLLADREDFLGMVFSTPVPLPLLSVMFTPEKTRPENCCLKLNEKVLVPSSLCVMVVLPLANVLVVLLSIPMVLVPL